MPATARLLTLDPEPAADPTHEAAAAKARGSRTVIKPDHSVADLAKRWKVSPDKVLAFIHRGDLIAFNVAAVTSARPQWRITSEAVERFEKLRTSAPPPKPQKRRRTTPAVDYYRD